MYSTLFQFLVVLKMMVLKTNKDDNDDKCFSDMSELF